MAHSFDVVDSELLLDAPILAVRRDQVRMPGGGVAAREVVEHLGAVAVVALDDQGRVAMVKQYRRSVDRRLWELPAGLLDIKGEDELTGAKRELAEEAGLRAQSWQVLADIVTSPGFCEEAVRIYLAQGLESTEPLHGTGDEEEDMQRAWVDLDAAVDGVFAGTITNSIACAGLLAAYAAQQRGQGLRDPQSPFELRPTSMASRRTGPDLKRP